MKTKMSDTDNKKELDLNCLKQLVDFMKENGLRRVAIDGIELEFHPPTCYYYSNITTNPNPTPLYQPPMRTEYDIK